jgi:hypothetical protein
MSPNCERKFSFKKSFIAVFSVGLFVLTLGAFAAGSHDHSQMDHSKMNKGEKMRVKLTPETKTLALLALAANDNLHNSFFNYKNIKIEKYAKELQTAIVNIKSKKIPNC